MGDCNCDLSELAEQINQIKQMPEEALEGLCDSLGGEDGFFDRCLEHEATDDMADPESFCAWLHNYCHDKWPGEESGLQADMGEKNMKKMETKMFEFDIKELDENTGVVTGHCSAFHIVDSDEDIVEPGAFERTIKDKQGMVPILSQHRHDKEIGMTTELMEDGKGLFFKGQLYVKQSDDDMYVPEAQSEYAKMKYRQKLGKPMPMSFGFEIQDAEIDDDGIRHLKDLDLWEISPVTFPAQPLASVSSVKSYAQEKLEAMQKDIKEGRVLSQENEALIRDAIDALENIISQLMENEDEEGQNTVAGGDDDQFDSNIDESGLDLSEYVKEFEEIKTRVQLDRLSRELEK